MLNFIKSKFINKNLFRNAKKIAFNGNLRYFTNYEMSNITVSDLYDFNEDQIAFRDNIREFVEKKIEPQAYESNLHNKFNIELFKELGQSDLLGITIPEEFGGQNLDATSACILYEEMSYSDPAIALSCIAHSILCAHNLNINGSIEQKKRWLPDLCNGNKVGGIAITEPRSGTDVLNMDTHYEKKNNEYILNGSKLYVTNTSYGDMFLVYGRDIKAFDDPSSKRKISLFMVEKNMPGFEQNRMIYKHGVKASPYGELSFHNVHIPKENLIGEEGKGLIPMMRNLEIERLTLAAQSLGIIRRCLVEMIKYSKTRTIGKNKLLCESDEAIRKITNAYGKYCDGGCKVYSCARHV